MALNYVTITGTFDDGSGTALNGTVTFTPSQTVYSSGVPLVSTSKPIVAQVINGLLKSPSGGTLQLLATDNTGLTFESLTGFFYWNVVDGVGGQSWSFFLNHTPATQDLYSLASSGGSGGFQNPMTTLGDIIYENATPAAARLAGSTSATKNFLTQTGTGTVSAAPAWGTIAASDLAATANEAGNAPLVLTPSGAMAWGLPWQFYPEAYGAKGNGKVIGDATIAGGALTTLTSASAAFTSADTGKTILVNGANGATAAPLITTITFVNSTTVTLASGAANAVTAGTAVYGNDDTAAINSAVTAAVNYATSGGNNRKAQIVFGAKIYCLTAATTKGSSSGPTYGNAQIPLPVPDTTGASQKIVIEFAGVGDGSELQYFNGQVAQAAGTVLASMLNLSSNDATWGVPSIIGGPTAASGSGWSLTGGFANIKPVVTGIKLLPPWNAWQLGFDFRFCAGAYVDKSGWQGAAPISVGQAPLLTAIPSNGNSIALYMPLKGNNADCKVGTFSVEGGVYGVAFSEHFNAQHLSLIYCNIAMFVNPPGAAVHGATILQANVEATNIAFQSGGGSADTFPVFIGLLDVEVINTRTIDDPSNTLTGLVNWQASDQSAPVVNGGANLKLVNDRLGPGLWSGAPAAPASTVQQQNTAWRDATIYLSGHTGITVVKVDATTTGLVAASGVVIGIRVPSGHNFTLTYTGTLTTTWVLD